MPLFVANHVGRLVEIRVQTPFVTGESRAFMGEVVRVIAAIGGKYVAVTDLRGAAKAADPESIDFVAKILRGENPKLERNALIAPAAAATLTLQMERMVKDAGSTNRRIFKTREEGEAWLAEVLDDAERARLSAFLDEAP